MSVLEVLKRHHNEYVKRNDLSSMVHCSDRDMRREVERLREEGYWIVNFEDGKGYMLTDSEILVAKYIKTKLRSRRNKIDRAIFGMEAKHYFKS